jgi:N utilization substance protein B
MARRSRAREISLQALYQRDQNRSLTAADAVAFLERRLLEPELLELGKALYLGTLEHLKEIDSRLAQVADNWSVERMAVVDRNILRLGIYELYHGPQTPYKVVLDEAIELAKRYGAEESPGFVNGILDRIANEKVDGEKAAAEAASAGAPTEGDASTPAETG